MSGLEIMKEQQHGKSKQLQVKLKKVELIQSDTCAGQSFIFFLLRLPLRTGVSD